MVVFENDLGTRTHYKHIRFWDFINGSMVHELDTGSQATFFPPLTPPAPRILFHFVITNSY